MAVRTGQVLVVTSAARFATLAAAAASEARCQLVSIATLLHARTLIAKKQFDLLLIDTAATSDDDLAAFLDLDLGNQGRIACAGQSALGATYAVERHIEHLSPAVSVEALTQLMKEALLRSPSAEIQADDAFSGMIGRTPRMQTLFGTLRRVAALDVGVLVQGESGTGKELVARALHTLSGRSGRFIGVNCGAVAPDLLASQMFGHERGAFTGALQSHAGYFEQAGGGTLFLDEITEMPPPLQVYLLRVIETHCLTRVGGIREIPVDVRIVAASNRDLQRAVAGGAFRQDLYFRLLEFPLAVPPLRERREDIPLLVRHFLCQLNTRYGTCRRISDHAIHQLSLRAWPGNVRELRYALQRLYILAAEDGCIDAIPEPDAPLLRRASDLGRDRAGQHGAGESLAGARSGHAAFTFGMTLDEIERTAILETLARCGNDKRAAARILGVSLKTIYNKLLRYRALGWVAGDDPDAVTETQRDAS